MKLSAVGFLALLLAFTALAEQPPRSVSTSRQFIVFAPDAPLRGAVCDVAERTKSNCLTLLRQPDRWKVPILVNLQFPQANLPDIPAAGLQLSQTGFGLKIQLDLLVTPDFSGPAVERDLLRAVLLEIMYRDLPQFPANRGYAEPPAWLSEGLLQLAPGRERAPAIELLQTLIEANKLTPLEHFLAEKPELLDATSRAVYRAYAMALVQLLLDLPDGPAALTRFLVALPKSGNDPVANLRAQFPMLAAGASAEKWWSLSIARLSTADRYKALSMDETESRLDRLLHVTLLAADHQPKLYKIEEFFAFMKAPDRERGLHALAQDLDAFEPRATPLYRPIVHEYAEIAHLLARGKVRGLEERLARASSTRAALRVRMENIADYLNWFEATQSATKSEAFADYLKSARESREAAPHRRDPISVYLDTIEAQSR